MNVDIKLPNLHAKQLEIVANAGKRNVICAGRRGGKTTLLSDLAVEWFLDGSRVVYGTPVAKQLKAFWAEVKGHLRPLIRSGHIYKNETDHILYWQHEGEGGAGISAQTAYNAETWRGDYGDKLIFDEFAYMHPDIWQKVGAPMLLDNDGDAWFISSPNRKNHFYHLYVRGNDPLDTRWNSFYFTSHDNPYLSKEALAEITQDMTEENYQQEILAMFLDSEGAVFRNIGANLWDGQQGKEDHASHLVMAGVDWGKHQDYTVISVGCADCMRELYIDRFNKIDYSFQRDRLSMAMRDYNVIHCLAESNAMGEPNLEMLQQEGLPVVGFQTTATSKPQLIENLKLSLERKEFMFLDVPVATAELESYEMTISANTGRPIYSAPAGVHDDTVIARALMRRAISNYMPAML